MLIWTQKYMTKSQAQNCPIFTIYPLPPPPHTHSPPIWTWKKILNTTDIVSHQVKFYLIFLHWEFLVHPKQFKLKNLFLLTLAWTQTTFVVKLAVVEIFTVKLGFWGIGNKLINTALILRCNLLLVLCFLFVQKELDINVKDLRAIGGNLKVFSLIECCLVLYFVNINLK